MRCDRVERLHGADAPALKRIGMAIPADADRASPGRIPPRLASTTKDRHQVRGSLRGLPGPEISQSVPQVMDICLECGVHGIALAGSWRVRHRNDWRRFDYDPIAGCSAAAKTPVAFFANHTFDRSKMHHGEGSACV